ncbi:hypothetical protein O181_082454 [Austropuccinia psidii MF-1]|uniref:Uncharacterized protein n=1 Tax=Austropuccinia psidii MF-1 TaxID=1389203 RepID=A0A9Q3IL21_9BASI|nr:hypothetical protein [Austropuccinia psidii MF-1]
MTYGVHRWVRAPVVGPVGTLRMGSTTKSIDERLYVHRATASSQISTHRRLAWPRWAEITRPHLTWCTKRVNVIHSNCKKSSQRAQLVARRPPAQRS